MSGIKPCIRCGRNIDANARLCPYCNWDQTQPVPALHADAAEAPVYVPPPERRWKKPVGAAIAIVILVLVTTLVLAERLRDTGPQAAPLTEQQLEQAKLQQKEAEAVAAGKVKQTQRANVTLVPDNSPAPSQDQPVTSAPTATTTDAMANEYQRTDATAASSAEYSHIAQRAQAEKKKMDVLVDPRSLTGIAYEEGSQPMPAAPPRQRKTVPPDVPPGAAAPAPGTSAAAQNSEHVVRTKAVPEYQPLPDLSVRETSTARLELTVGADGLVKSVNVKEPIAADMGRLISSIQSWRFKPATENGVPVPSSFVVELSFHGSE